MNIIKAFDTAFQRAKKYNYEYVYVLIDIHDTIFKACWNKTETYEYLPYAKETLHLLSICPFIKTILWTSSYDHKIISYINKFSEDSIYFDYINKNPECLNTKLACFDKKFYFNVGIDNAFGFEPETDWKELYNYLLNINNDIK